MSEDQSQIPEEQTPEELEHEQMALDAIFNDQPFTLTVKAGPKGNQTEHELRFRWPDATDDQQVSLLTTRYCSGMPPELVPDADYEYARSRAVLEVLAEGPFGDVSWLPPSDEKIEYRGKKVLRPDTSKSKARGLIVAFGREFYAFITRHQYLAGG